MIIISQWLQGVRLSIDLGTVNPCSQTCSPLGYQWACFTTRSHRDARDEDTEKNKSVEPQMGGCCSEPTPGLVNQPPANTHVLNQGLIMSRAGMTGLGNIITITITSRSRSGRGESTGQRVLDEVTMTSLGALEAESQGRPRHRIPVKGLPRSFLVGGLCRVGLGGRAC